MIFTLLFRIKNKQEHLITFIQALYPLIKHVLKSAITQSPKTFSYLAIYENPFAFLLHIQFVTYYIY